jgi:hypothetical protein
MKTIQEKMDYEKEEMKTQVGSLVSRFDANQEKKKEEMKTGQVERIATVSAILQKMNSWREETKAHLEKREANP